MQHTQMRIYTSPQDIVDGYLMMIHNRLCTVERILCAFAPGGVIRADVVDQLMVEVMSIQTSVRNTGDLMQRRIHPEDSKGHIRAQKMFDKVMTYNLKTAWDSACERLYEPNVVGDTQLRTKRVRIS
jgi:hypothetical protein